MIGAAWISKGLVWLLVSTPAGAVFLHPLHPTVAAVAAEGAVVQVLPTVLPTGLRGPIQMALSFLGAPYRLGGVSRDGIDCAGLVRVAYQTLGFTLPHTAGEQFEEGVEVSLGEMQPGDLVFFRDTYKQGISHVGIYIGDGKFIHAASTKRGVVMTSLSANYYLSRFAGAKRLVASVTADAGAPAKTGVQAGETVAAAR
jgi:hypothetical protein